MNPHLLGSPNWFCTLFNLIFFFSVLADHFSGRQKRWNGTAGNEGKGDEGGLRRIPNERRAAEWNVNSKRRLAEWQSASNPQRECLMIAGSWHLGGPLNWDASGLGFTARLDRTFIDLSWQLRATTSSGLWERQQTNHIWGFFYRLWNSGCNAGIFFSHLCFSYFLLKDGFQL